MALTVYNRGTVPTQITHLVVYAFDSPFKRWNWENPVRTLRSRPSLNGFISAPNVPAKLDINAYFIGQALYNTQLKELRAKGQLYFGVISAHSTRNFIIRVPPAKPGKTPKDKLPAA